MPGTSKWAAHTIKIDLWLFLAGSGVGKATASGIERATSGSDWESFEVLSEGPSGSGDQTLVIELGKPLNSLCVTFLDFYIS